MPYASAYNYGFLNTAARDVFVAYSFCSIAKIAICNTSSTNATFDLYQVPKDKSTSNIYALFKGQSIRKNQTIMLGDEIQLATLRPGDRLTALASAADSVTMTIYKALANPDYEQQVRMNHDRLQSVARILRRSKQSVGLQGRSMSVGNETDFGIEAPMVDRYGVNY